MNFGEIEFRHQPVGLAGLQRLAEARGRGVQLPRLQSQFAKLVQQQAIVRLRGQFGLTRSIAAG